MTIQEILKSVAAVVGSYSEASFRRDLARLNIQPLGSLRTVPRHYPNNTPDLICVSRGFETAFVPPAPLPVMDTAVNRLVTLPRLKRAARSTRITRKARAAR